MKREQITMARDFFLSLCLFVPCLGLAVSYQPIVEVATEVRFVQSVVVDPLGVNAFVVYGPELQVLKVRMEDGSSEVLPLVYTVHLGFPPSMPEGVWVSAIEDQLSLGTLTDSAALWSTSLPEPYGTQVWGLPFGRAVAGGSSLQVAAASRGSILTFDLLDGTQQSEVASEPVANSGLGIPARMEGLDAFYFCRLRPANFPGETASVYVTTPNIVGELFKVEGRLVRGVSHSSRHKVLALAAGGSLMDGGTEIVDPQHSILFYSSEFGRLRAEVSLENTTAAPHSLAFSIGESSLLVGGEEGNLETIDCQSGFTLVGSRNLPNTGTITGIGANSDLSRVLIVDHLGRAAIWNLAD